LETVIAIQSILENKKSKLLRQKLKIQLPYVEENEENLKESLSLI
jgi:hypothetical protein